MAILKNLVMSQDQMRDILLKMMKEEPRAIYSWAKEIGITDQTLKRFLEGDTKLDSKRSMIMQNYLEKHGS